MKKLSYFLAFLLIFTLCLVSCGENEPGGTSSGTMFGAKETSSSVQLSVSVGVLDPTDNPESLFEPMVSNGKQETDVMQDDKYDAVFLNISIADFLSAGFAFGDSCDIVFSNGLTFTDLPFYNGYYVRTGAPLIVGYPGYKYVAVTCNNQGLWTKSGLKDGDNAVVTLREAGKYADVQEALSQTYSNDRNEYPDDETFVNFRALRGGRLKQDFLYRGASPVDSQKNRAAYADALIAGKEVGFILDLADSQTDMEGYLARLGFSSDYARGLYENGKIALLGMSSNYGSDAYKQKLASGLVQMLGAEGRIYIHCLEGKDRTGFVCLLLEALAGASYDEMLSDYMKTYENYYGVTKESAKEKYDAIADLYFNAFVSYLHGTEDIETLKTAVYEQDAEQYLADAGMTEEEIRSLKTLITG